MIEQTGAQDVTLVGFSMGGGEVARYMSRHGGRRVVKTALISSVLPYRLKTADNPGGTEQAVFDQTTQAILTDRASFFTGFFEKFFGPRRLSHSVSDEVRAWAHGIAMQASLRATLACQKSFTGTDFRQDLAAFKTPTLIIHGNDDQIVPIDASSRPTAQGIAAATLIEYDAAPHGLFATDKLRLNRDLLDFLGR